MRRGFISPTVPAALAATALMVALAAPAAAQITVTDDLGRAVTVPKPAERIISLAPHITENLFSAGAGARIVGVVDHSDYPPAARRIASIGSYALFSLESVVALSPDLVVAWQTAANRESIAAIARFGVPVYYSEPRDFAGIISNIEELAQLAGSRARINPPAAELRAEIAAARARYAGAEPLRVFYQVWSAPLMTLGGGHFISRVLEVCGARNIFAASSIMAPRVGIEAVVRADPDLIISGRGADFGIWKKWRAMRAVKRGAFVAVDSDVMHRHTARMIMGVRGVCEAIDEVRRGNSSAAGD